MSRTPFDRRFTSIPFDVNELFSHENDAPPRNSSYGQATPHNVQRYVEPSNPLPGPFFAAGVQIPGAMNEYMHPVPGASTQFHNELIHEWPQDNTSYAPWNNFQRADLNGFYPGYPSPSVERVSQEPTSTRAPTEVSTPRSSRHGHGDNDSLSDPIQCKWQDCTSSRSYGRPSSLLRHVREKHVSPNVFRCSVPQCGRSFGRGDKLQEHLRSHENKELRKGSKRHSCHEGPCTEI
ncbi:unnamed protein product [Penicillium bialowiezense]